jgi:fibronectin-binding autotransporter adhesin
MNVKSSRPVRKSHTSNLLRLLSGTSLGVVALVALPSPTQAQQTVYWDANGPQAGSGGNGDWNTTSTNQVWSQSNSDVLGPYGPWVNDPANPNNAIFGVTAPGTTTTAGTITLTGPITVHNMTFQSVHNWVLNGGTLTLAGTTPTISTPGNTTINSIIAGTAGLTKTGVSALFLNGTNTFSGGIALNGGSIYADDDAALGALTNSFTTAASTQVRLAIAAGSTNRSVTIGNAGTLILEGAGAGSALISGAGNVSVGIGVTMSNAANTYTGTTTFGACNGVCTTSFTSIANLGQASALGAPTTAAAGTITWNQTSQYSDYLVYLGDGDTSNRNWTFNVGSSGVFDNRGTGTLTLTGDMAVTGTIQFSAVNADFAPTGVVSNGAGIGNVSLVGSASGAVTLGGANTYTGTTSISGGVVNVSVLANGGVDSSLGAGTLVNLRNNGILNYTGAGASSDRTFTTDNTAELRNSGTGALTLSGAMSFVANAGTDTLRFGGNYAGTNTYSGVISGAGNLASAGSSTWLLTGANTRTGTLTVDGGTLRAGNASAFGTITGVTVDGGTLDLNNINFTTPTLNGTGGQVALGSGTLTVGGSTGSSYSGGITGTGGLTKLGTGTLTLSGSNTYTGATTVGGGTLALSFPGAGSNIISSSSALVMSGSTLTATGASGQANSQTFNGLTVTAGNNRISAIGGGGGTMAINLGALTNTGGLMDFATATGGSITTSNSDGALGWATVNGSDYAQVLGGNIVALTTYTNKDNPADWVSGEVVSDQGNALNTPYAGILDENVQLGGLKYTAAATSNVNLGGNTLGVNGAIIVGPSVGTAIQSISNGSLTGSVGGGTLGIQQNGTSTTSGFTISATIVDNGGAIGFTKGGTGIVQLQGANTYTGATTVGSGLLAVTTIGNGGEASNIGQSTNASSNLVLEGGTLRYLGVTDTTDRGFTLVNGGASRTIEVTDGAANLTFTGLVTSPDDAGLTKAGPGTLTLANDANNYTGTTTVSGGILSVDTLANGGAASGIGQSSAASSNLVLQTGGTLQYTGADVSSDRGFTLASGVGGIDVGNGATTLTLSGVAAGTGSLTKSGAGTLVLSGTNTYTGNTTVSAGTLRAGSAQAFGSTPTSVAVSSGATLDINSIAGIRLGTLTGGGNVALGSATLTVGGVNSGSPGFTGTISGTGGFTKTAGGTQVMTGCNNSYTGITTINGGAISTDCILNGGVNSGIGASSSSPTNLVIRDSGLLDYSAIGANQTTDRGFTLENSIGYVQVSDAGTTLTFTGVVGGAGHFVKRGAGTLVLAGANTFTGQTRVEAGRLAAGSNDAFDQGADQLLMSNVAGAVFDLNGYNATFRYLQGGGALGGNIALGTGTLTLNNPGGGPVDYAGAISGAGNLVLNSALTQLLTSCNSSYTGTTTVSGGGVIQVACLANGGVNSSIGAAGASASNIVLNGGALEYVGTGGSTDRLFSLAASTTSGLKASGTGAIQFTNTGPIAFLNPNTTQAVRLGGTSTANNSLAALITNNGTGTTSLTKADAGTWILTNSANTYTGITSITGGVLGVDNLADGGFASSLGMSSSDATNLVIGSGATLRYTGAGDTTNRQFMLGVGSTTIESSGTGAISFTSGSAASYSGTGARVVSLGGTYAGDNMMAATIGNQNASNITSLAKSGAGRWILTGTNTYTGNTNVNQGTLIIGNGGTAGSIASTTSIVSAGGVLGFNRSDTVSYTGTITGLGGVQQLGTGTTVFTGTNTYTGGTTISAGTLQLGTGASGGATGSIVGNVANNGTFAFNRNNAYTFAGVISGTGPVTQIGSGATTLTGTNTYSAITTVTSGTLQVGDGGTTGSLGSGNVVNNSALIFNRSNDLTAGNAISGMGTLTKAGAGTLVLTANNSYTGGTTITAGTLQIGAGGATGGITGNVLNNGALVANRSGTLTLGGVISGGGSFTQLGSGTTILTAANTYAGATTVSAGTLLVNGNQSGATGLTSVASGAMLGGNGTIGGSVSIADGGTLAAGSDGVGTLTVNGNLALGNTTQLNFEFGQANVPGGPLNDLVNVGGNLTLDGVVNVTQTPSGTFGPGVYRMFNYAGTLTNNGVTLGPLPGGSAGFIQTALANQVNLVNTAGLTLNFWDGAAGPKNDSLIQGGNGVWRVGGGENNWTEVNGAVNADYSQDSFAIFQGTGGTVTVDNTGSNVSTAGMQFTAGGYTIAGAPLTLTGTPDAFIRVGDSSAGDAGLTATISAALTGASRLVKDLGGTLVLTGTNTYTGGTAINGGTLRIASDANLGDAASGLSFNGGTLNTTATFSSARTIDLAGAGTFLTDGATTLTLTGLISGTGALTKDGAGALLLTNANTYAGGTTISAGMLQLGNGGTTGSIAGNVSNNGALAFNRSNNLTFAGTVTGTGAVNQIGSGTTILTADNAYTGGTTISAGILQLGAGGATGGITGDVTNNAALVFNRSNEVTFAGLISGTGRIAQAGAGTTVLTGANSYSGTTTVFGGTLFINGDQSLATGATSVATGATLGGVGTIGGDVTVADGATLAPGDATGPGTLTINGNLSLASTARLDYEFGQSNVVGGPLNDLTSVGGNLTLDGTMVVTVSPGGSFDIGLYRVISYSGTLTDNGLALGTLPPGTLASVQTSVAGQVNLINATGATLNFWDGAAPANKGDGAINGGDGTWQNSSGNDNWTELTGTVNGAYTDASFAIFAAAPGAVNIDNSLGAVTASGLQFAVDGYTVTGEDLTLVGPQSVIRVGDGAADGLGYVGTIASAITGASQLVKTDLGTLVLSGTNSYTGGTRINVGTLRISSDANLGAAAGDLSFDGGTLHTTANISSARNVDLIGTGTFLTDAGTSLILTGALSGAGNLVKDGAGTLALNDTSNHSGTTSVLAGSLFVNGDQSAALGVTSVASGSALGGSGIIGGDVVVGAGGRLAPGNSPGTLTINGGLALDAASILDFEFGQANVAGGLLNDLVNVGGDLTLDGTINVAVSAGGTFGPGIYRVFNYGGTLTNNGVSLGALPGGSQVSVQTAIAGQVNLVNPAGLTLRFWDGAAGPKNNGAIDGGNGVWRLNDGSSNWADASGNVNADYTQDSFAVFSGAPGTVTLDNAGGNILASGLQFASNGYTISGDILTLTGPQAIVQVGDSSVAGAGYTAAIDAALGGSAALVKTDAGTLVLTGTNSYTGGTVISGGTLRISSDSNLGDAAGSLSLGGGTLNTAADISTARAVGLTGSGTFLTDAATTLTLAGTVSGAGSLTQDGGGTLVLSGTGTHTGATNVGAGTLLVNGDYAGAPGATTVAAGASLGGTGTIGGNVSLVDGAILTPGSSGAGTLTINGGLGLSSGSRLAFEFGQANTAGGTLNDLVNVGGDLVLDGTIDVTVSTGGAFDVGVYRVFNYGGTLTNNGLVVGTLPGGASASVQTSIAGQVNLVNTGGLTLGFWDGAAGPKNNNVVNGGSGTWENGSGNDNWTDANGTLNEAFSDGTFAVFGGTAGTVTVDNGLGQVTATGMQFAANGYTITGGGIALEGPQSIIRVGDGSTGGAGFTATINAGLSGDTQLVKTDAGTLVLGGINSYTGGTLVSGGTVQISADASLGTAAGNVTLDGGTLATSANVTSARDIVMADAGTISSASGTTFTFNGLLSGTGALTQTGAGTLLMTGNNAAFAGSTRVEGTMIVNGSLCGDVNVATGGRLGGTGTICTTVNAGTIAPGNSIGTLTVAGTYTGNNGTLEIEAELGGDMSPTDRLVVTGATSGTTQVNVINTGGLGAATVEGIKIVDIGGASDGVFTLKGDYVFEGDQAVIAGAYGYRLYKNGVATPTDGDWYLRSSLLNPTAPNEPQAPLYQPGVPLYESYAATLQTLNRLGTLQERVGNRQWSGFTQGEVGMWGRIESTRYRPEAVVSTSGSDLDVNDWSLQAGFDKALLDTSAGTLIAGVNGRYGKADAQVRSRFGNGKIDTKGYGAGATLTWYDSTGFYADAQAQISWYRGDLRSSVLGTLVDDNHGSGEAFSLEVGKRAPLGGGLSVTPQIQMAYSNVRFDAFADPHGAAVSSDRPDSLKSRWGLSLDHQRSWDGTSGSKQSHVYGIVNLSYEWLDGAVTDVSGTPLERRDNRLWGEVGVGGSYSWNDGRFTIFSEVSANTAINNFGDSNSLRGNAGFRMKF